MQGDWRRHHEANKELLYVIEPVIESLVQLLVQSILVYVVLGPSDSIDGIGGSVISYIWVVKYSTGWSPQEAFFNFSDKNENFH